VNFKNSELGGGCAPQFSRSPGPARQKVVPAAGPASTAGREEDRAAAEGRPLPLRAVAARLGEFEIHRIGERSPADRCNPRDFSQRLQGVYLPRRAVAAVPPFPWSVFPHPLQASEASIPWRQGYSAHRRCSGAMMAEASFSLHRRNHAMIVLVPPRTRASDRRWLAHCRVKALGLVRVARRFGSSEAPQCKLCKIVKTPRTPTILRTCAEIRYNISFLCSRTCARAHSAPDS
jgi:hypothetical protein